MYRESGEGISEGGERKRRNRWAEGGKIEENPERKGKKNKRESKGRKKLK